MATSATIPVGTDHWNAEMYGSMSRASRLSAAIAEAFTQRSIPYRIAFCFWRVNSHLESFLDGIDESIRKAQRGELPVPVEPTDPKSVAKSVDALIDLHLTLEDIYQTSKQKRLTNYSMVAAGVNRLHRNSERIEELAHLLNDLMNPSEIEDVFSKALAEYESKEIIATAGSCH